MDVREYVDADGRSPFREWFDGLDAPAAARVATAVTRMEQGSLSRLKSVGSGVMEYRIDSGPGYRLYLGRDGDELIILLTGGTKRRQRRDIERAWTSWEDYKWR